MHPVDDHDVHRFEDEGGNTIPFRVGIPPADEPVVLKDTRAERPRHRDARLRLVDTGAERVVDPAPVAPPVLFIAGQSEAPAEAPKILDARGEEVSSLTWPSFLAWRKTKCRPFDREQALMVEREFGDRDPLLEEIDQATHELVGEVAELGELFMEHGPTVFFGELREKLIDEIGDIFFCAAWALDSWGMNPLADADDLEILRVTDESDLAGFAQVIGQRGGETVLKHAKFVSALGGLVFNLLLTAQTNAGLTANSFKKLKFQRREQPVELQVKRIVTVLFAVNQLLIVANSSVEEALQVNQRKLNARYPNGYQPGQGGGNREGAGR